MPRDINSLILNILRRGPMRTQQEIADVAGVSRGSAVEHLKHLVAVGDVVRGYAARGHGLGASGYVFVRAPVSANLQDNVESILRESQVVMTYQLVGSERYDYIATLAGDMRAREVQNLVRSLKKAGVKTETLAALGEAQSGGYRA